MLVWQFYGSQQGSHYKGNIKFAPAVLLWLKVMIPSRDLNVPFFFKGFPPPLLMEF